MFNKVFRFSYGSVVKFGKRNCSTQGKSNTDIPTQNVKVDGRFKQKAFGDPIPGLPKPVYLNHSEMQNETQVTTLSNGLKVASEKKFGSFCTVGVLLNSGSRFEVASLSGISHFLEKLAFGATKNMTRDEIMRGFENLGGICDCQSSRDTLIYAASVESRNLDKALEILGEAVLRPLITERELQDSKLSVNYDLEAMNMNPEKDTVLFEMIHDVAFRGNSLGLPKVCPSENVTGMTRDSIMSYLRSHHTPDQMVVAAVGVEHEPLVEYAQKYFVDQRPIWEEEENTKRLIPRDESIAQYTGGIKKIEMDLSDVSLGPNPLPELAHIVIGLESVGHQHEDFVTCCVLNMIMGGGGSFSAGGPGKGMYTRLYTNVLNRCHWMHTATARSVAYIDGGLFYVQAAAHPSHLADMTYIISSELVAMESQIKEEEFQRAKVQLKSMLLMNLESRPVLFEDVGRQVLATGNRIHPEHLIKLINDVTPDDIRRVVSRMLRQKPSVAALGSLNLLPPLAKIETALLDRSNRKEEKKSKFNIFR